MSNEMKIIELHTSVEIEAEVERLRPELDNLIARGEIRPHGACIENDLRVLAYNRLTEKKFA
jgi:hypothetical protein